MEIEDDSEVGWNFIVFLVVEKYNLIDVEKKFYFKIIVCKIWIFKKNYINCFKMFLIV